MKASNKISYEKIFGQSNINVLLVSFVFFYLNSNKLSN